MAATSHVPKLRSSEDGTIAGHVLGVCVLVAYRQAWWCGEIRCEDGVYKQIAYTPALVLGEKVT